MRSHGSQQLLYLFIILLNKNEFHIVMVNLVAICDRLDMRAIWKLIWRWNGPQRIRSFLWIVDHNRLLTNEHRVRCILTNSDLCTACQGSIETPLHILLDYPNARNL